MLVVYIRVFNSWMLFYVYIMVVSFEISSFCSPLYVKLTISQKYISLRAILKRKKLHFIAKYE
jgi:hypothetical protein